jgi:hypothetical protein
MAKSDPEATVRLDLNNPVFQQNLLTLQKPDRHAALDTLGRLRQMTLGSGVSGQGLEVGKDWQHQAAHRD